MSQAEYEPRGDHQIPAEDDSLMRQPQDDPVNDPDVERLDPADPSESPARRTEDNEDLAPPPPATPRLP
jgi:hypothetical protein